MNHVLKQATDWKKKSLTKIVELIQNVVCGQFKELRAALIRTGELSLADTNKQFSMS